MGLNAQVISRRRLDGPVLTLAATAAALVVPLLWLILTRTDRSVGDLALIELRTRDVLSMHPPLTGAYSRYGWSHPGPLMFYVFAVPYRLLGDDADALRLTVLAFNTCVIVTIGVLLRRRGRAAFALGLAATVALAWGMLPHALSDGWNVTVSMMPLLLAVVACWCSWCGDRGALLVAALATSWVVQAHIGFGIVLAPVLLVTVGRRLAEHRRTDVPLGRRSRAAVAAVLAVSFGAALVDAVRDVPGNLARLAKWSLTNDEPSIGAADAVRIIGRTSSLSFLPHPRFPGRFLLTIDHISTGLVPGLALVLLAAAYVLASRRDWPAERSLVACVAIVWASGAIACATVTRPLASWLIDWLQPLGWVTWFTIALVAWRWIRPALRDRRLVNGLAAFGGVALVVGTVQYARTAFDTEYLSAADRTTIDALSSAAVAAIESSGERTPMRIEWAGDPLTAGTIHSGVVNRVDGSGADVCVAPEPSHQYGTHRICAGRADVHLLVRAEPMAMAVPDGADTLAVSDPLAEDERAEADRLVVALSAALDAAGHHEMIPLLYSPLTDLLLTDATVAPQLVDVVADIRRLDALRDRPGNRVVLYLVHDAP